MCLFTWSCATEIEATASYAYFCASHFCISFSWRSDAVNTAPNLPSTPLPSFIDMRRAFGTNISVGLCSYFFLCTIGRTCSGDFHRSMVVKSPSKFPIFLGGSFGKCISGSDTLAIRDRSWTPRVELQSLRGI